MVLLNLLANKETCMYSLWFSASFIFHSALDGLSASASVYWVWLGWVNFLHSSLHSAMLWICDCDSADNTATFWLCSCSMKDASFLHWAPLGSRLGCARCWLSHLTPSDTMLSNKSLGKGRMFVVTCVLRPHFPRGRWTPACWWEGVAKLLCFACAESTTLPIYLLRCILSAPRASSVLHFVFSSPTLSC